MFIHRCSDVIELYVLGRFESDVMQIEYTDSADVTGYP